MSRPRSDDVVVTGIGCVGPLGSDRESLWKRLVAGDCGVRRLTEADFHGLPLEGNAGSMVGAPALLHQHDATREPVLELIGLAADEAMRHAELVAGSFDHDRAGCVVGTSKGGLVTFGRWMQERRSRSRSSVDWSQFLPHAASSRIAAQWSLRGPCLSPVAACATGLVSVIRGAALIRDGICDLVVAGSGDASLHPAVLASFRRMGVLASRFDDPKTACRPFNRDRDGFAVGEGAAIFVLERRRHAEARGVQAIATFLGGAVLSDPTGMTAVDLQGETLSRAILDALSSSGITADQLGHMNLHGTATVFNDLAESAALRCALGRRAESIPCVALKGAMGHLLGAAGAIELAASALAIRDRILPPVATLTDLDPACPLLLSGERRVVSGCGLKISLGFGGHVAAACLGPV